MSYVEIAVARPVHGTYTYAAPPAMGLAIGHMVQVQFGRQKVAGYVVGLAETTDLKRVRPVHALMDPKPGFNADQLAFFRWMAEYYLSGLGEVIATAALVEDGAELNGQVEMTSLVNSDPKADAGDKKSKGNVRALAG